MISCTPFRRGALGFPQFDVSIEAIVPLFTAAASDTPRKITEPGDFRSLMVPTQETKSCRRIVKLGGRED